MVDCSSFWMNMQREHTKSDGHVRPAANGAIALRSARSRGSKPVRGSGTKITFFVLSTAHFNTEKKPPRMARLRPVIGINS
jgi:hypothetical protein